MPNIVSPPGGNATAAALTDRVLLSQGATDRSATLQQVKNAVLSGVTAGHFYPEAYGAVGDGASHPAQTYLNATFSAGITTLAGLKAWNGGIYAHAEALDDEIDGLAIIACINAIKALTGNPGGVVMLGGRYRASNRIALPAADEEGPGTISLQGASSGSSTLTLVKELTATRNAVYFIDCESRGVASTGSGGFIADLQLIGPRSQSLTFGTKAGFTSGIGWGARRKMHNVIVSRFYAGFCITGDQTQFNNCKARVCDIGLYFDVQNPNLFGDFHFNKCIFENCSTAAVACSHLCHMIKAVWTKSITAASPVAFLKETNGGSPTDNSLMHGCTFINHQFENLGVAAFTDDRTTATRVARISGSNTMFDCQFGQYNSAFTPSGGEWIGMFDLYSNEGELYIRGINEPNLWVPGSAGMLNFVYHQKCVIEGDIDNLIYNMTLATGTAVNNWTPNGSANNIRFIARQWKGRLFWVAGITAAVNKLIGIYANNTGAATDIPWGVVKHVGSTSTGLNWAIIAQSGEMSVESSGTVTSGKLCRTATGNTITDATGAADVTSPICGIVITAGTPSWVQLRPIE